MSELNFFLSNYSATEVLAILIAAVFLVVALLKAVSFIWDKVKQHFDIENSEDRWKISIGEKIDNIGTSIGILQKSVNDLESKADERGQRLAKVEKYIKEDRKREEELFKKIDDSQEAWNRVEDRLQDDTRWAFKDAYNYYYLKAKKIDTSTLEALEKKYEHYKAAGGNSFVDNIMENLRELPIVESMGD